MSDERRDTEHSDRRARSRGGRRPYDQKKPWYMRRRLWLATASLAFLGWRKLRGFMRRSSVNSGSPGNGVTV